MDDGCQPNSCPLTGVNLVKDGVEVAGVLGHQLLQGHFHQLGGGSRSGHFENVNFEL
jgi:hypothetical protein